MAPTSPGTPRSIWLRGLGVQCWLLWIVGPRVYRNALSGADLAWSALPAVAWVALWLSARRGRAPSPLLSLMAYPASLAASVAAFDPEQALSTYSAPVLAIGALSLLAFAATASSAAGAPQALREASVQPLGESHLSATDPRRARWQRGVLVGVSLALLALVLFGSRGSALHYYEHWGAAAAAGATLTAICSGLIGAAAMAGIVGPALRAERPTSARGPTEQRRRLLWLFAVAISGALAYAMLVLAAR